MHLPDLASQSLMVLSLDPEARKSLHLMSYIDTVVSFDSSSYCFLAASRLDFSFNLIYSILSFDIIAAPFSSPTSSTTYSVSLFVEEF